MTSPPGQGYKGKKGGNGEASGEPGCLAVTLGRHCGISSPRSTPGTRRDSLTEYGWGARDIDPAAWQPSERKEGPSIWGHDRAWLSPEQRTEARAMRLANAERGLGRPVQVLLPGNHEVMAGVCPMVRRHQAAAEARVIRAGLRRRGSSSNCQRDRHRQPAAVPAAAAVHTRHRPGVRQAPFPICYRSRPAGLCRDRPAPPGTRSGRR